MGKVKQWATDVAEKAVDEVLDKLKKGLITKTTAKDNITKLDVNLGLVGIDEFNIDEIIEGKANFIEQDHSKATYANKINKSEGKINWNFDADQILGLINGLYPTPGAWFINKGKRYKILKAELGDLNGKPGVVLSENLEIACKKKSLKILEIQREGKKVQKSSEFLLGSRIIKGSNLNNV